MRPEEDVHAVFRFAAAGHTTSEIARRVGIARSTVRDWVTAGEMGVLARPGRSGGRTGHEHSCVLADHVDESAYAYLLGPYLGDGCISRMRFSFRLRARKQSVALLDEFVVPKE